MPGFRPSLKGGALAACIALVSSAAGAEPPPKAEQPASPDASPPRTETMTPEAALARATAFYDAGGYARCSEGFGRLLDDPTQAAALGPRAREQARVYRAACLIAQGKVEEADAEFRFAVRDNPQMAVPNAVVFPPAVIERFVVVRTELLGEIRRSEEERARVARDAVEASKRRAEAERRRVAELERLAKEETVVVRNSRWLASVPFGTGQFQNRDYVLGAAFLASEVILLGTAVTAVSIELSLNSQASRGLRDGTLGPAQTKQLNQNLATANRVALVSTGSLLGVAILGVVQAHLGFVPEFQDGTRPRKDGVPSKAARRPSVAPSVTPLTGGAEFGVVGRF